MCITRTLRQGVILIAALWCALLASSQSTSAARLDDDGDVSAELASKGKQGQAVARARQQVLAMLRQPNGCLAWFQESDPDPAGVFRSLHFELESTGSAVIYSMRNAQDHQIFQHPWAARAEESDGRGSTIHLNGNGPFFNRTSQIMRLDPSGTIAWPGGNHLLTISGYAGDTPEAQIIILLHELGHIIGRLPEDNGSWDGRSAQNTAEVVRHCKSATSAAARQTLRSALSTSH
jgi:hypothetical protein